MSLADTLKGLKSKINNFEEEFETKIKEVEEKEAEEKKIQAKKDALINILQKKEKVITLNVGGKIFKCAKSMLTSLKDSLFEKLFEDDSFDNETVFFDRSYNYFDVILNYIRTKSFNHKDYLRAELEDIKFESDYYSLNELSKILNDILSQVVFISFTSSGRYSSCGTHKLEDLSTKDTKTGICVQSPYYITIELNFEHEFEKIEVAGFTGNSGTWSPSNGSNAQVLTSSDGISFKEVGRLTSLSSTINTITLKKSTAKFIKFQHNGYLGLGYLNILKN